MTPPRVLLFDAFDSFIHTIAQYFARLGAETTVQRIGGDWRTAIRRTDPHLTVLGPGPGRPEDTEYVEILRSAEMLSRPLFGVCLGHQAVGLAFGAQVVRAPEVRHGKSSHITHDGSGFFAGLDAQLSVVRYHSLVVSQPPADSQLVVTATSLDDGQIMAMQHLTRPISSIQFHPESIASMGGLRLLGRVLAIAQENNNARH